MSKDTLKFTLEVDIDIDGRHPGERILQDSFIEAMNEVFPYVLRDTEDYVLFAESWSIKAVDAQYKEKNT